MSSNIQKIKELEEQTKAMKEAELKVITEKLAELKARKEANNKSMKELNAELASINKEEKELNAIKEELAPTLKTLPAAKSWAKITEAEADAKAEGTTVIAKNYRGPIPFSAKVKTKAEIEAENITDFLMKKQIKEMFDSATFTSPWNEDGIVTIYSIDDKKKYTFNSVNSFMNPKWTGITKNSVLVFIGRNYTKDGDMFYTYYFANIDKDDIFNKKMIVPIGSTNYYFLKPKKQ